jgi:hypothetical protein
MRACAPLLLLSPNYLATHHKTKQILPPLLPLCPTRVHALTAVPRLPRLLPHSLCRAHRPLSSTSLPFTCSTPTPTPLSITSLTPVTYPIATPHSPAHIVSRISMRSPVAKAKSCATGLTHPLFAEPISMFTDSACGWQPVTCVQTKLCP